MKYTVGITAHAKHRMEERLDNGWSGVDPLYIAKKAFNEGSRPPKWFRPDFAGRPEGFDAFVYREYRKMVFCFGVKSSEALLLTIYIKGKH